MFAAQAAVAIQNARLFYTHLEEAAAQLEAKVRARMAGLVARARRAAPELLPRCYQISPHEGKPRPPAPTPDLWVLARIGPPKSCWGGAEN